MENLPEIFWRRVDEVLAEQGLNRRDLKRKVHRNKNTHTRWFSEPRPDPTLTLVADIATALTVNPADLLSDGGGEMTQLSLLFPETGLSAQLEMRWTGRSVVLRKAPSSEAGEMGGVSRLSEA